MKDDLEKIKEAYLNKPNDEKIALSYGKALMYNHMTDEALNIFLNIKSDIYKEEVIFCTAKAYHYLGDLDKAEELYKSLFKTKNEGRSAYELSQIYIQKVKKLKDKKNNLSYMRELKENVYDYLNKSIQNKPTFKAYICLVHQQFLDHRMEEALENCNIILEHKSWLQKQKNYYFVKLRMAEIYYWLDRLNEAKELLSELLCEEYQNNQQILKIMGLIYIKEGNLIEASKIVENVSNDIEAYDLYYAYAKLCSDYQDFEKAILYYTKCKDSYIKYQSNHQLAKIHRKLGNFEESKKIYNLMLEGNNIDKNIGYLGLATCERVNRNYQKALENLNCVTNPNIQDKCELLLEKYKIYSLMGKISDGKLILDELISLNYNNYGLFEYGKMKMKSKDYSEAINAFNKISKSKGTYEWLGVLYIGKVYKYMGDHELAKKYFKSVPETSFDAYYEALGELIECALDEKDIPSAEKYLLKFENAKKVKDKDSYYYYKGLIARTKGDYELAISFFEKTILNEIRDYAITELAKIYWKNFDNVEKASEYINELICSENAISKAQGYFLYGHMYYEIGDYEKAKEYLNYNIINNNYRKDDSLALVANCEIMSMNYQKALDICLLLNQNNDRYNARNMFKLANIYLKMERYEEAKEIFANLVKLNKDNKNEALLRLSIIEFKNKNYDESLAILEKLYNTDLENFARIWQAKIYNALNRFDEASRILKSLLQTNNRRYALLELSLLEYSRDNLKAALKYINKLIDEGNNRDVTFGYYHKGKIFQKEGLLDKAKECFIRILNVDNLCNFKIDEDEINLNDIKIAVDKNTVLLELGSVEEALGNLKDAEMYYKMVDESSHNWKFAIKSLVFIKGIQKQYEEAEMLIKELENKSFNDLALLARGKLLSFYGKYEESRKCLSKVSDKNREEAIYLSAKTYLYEGNLQKSNSLFEELALISNETLFYPRQYLKKISIITNDNNDREIYEKYKSKLPESLLKLIYLNIYENRLSEALKDAFKLFEVIEYKEKAITILTYLSKELNIILEEKYYGSSNYFRNQILHYDKDYAENHIKFDMRDTFESLFNPNVSLDLIMEIIYPLLNEENFIYNNFFDTYIIPFEQIGNNGENYLAVQTLPKSKNIIRMYPTTRNFEDVEALVLDDDFARTKSLS